MHRVDLLRQKRRAESNAEFERTMERLERSWKSQLHGPQDARIKLHRTGYRTWVAEIRVDGEWQFMKAPLVPKINAKFISRKEALKAALEIVNK